MSWLTLVYIADVVALLFVVFVFFVVFIALSDRRTIRWERRLRKWRQHRRAARDREGYAHAPIQPPQAKPAPIARRGPVVVRPARPARQSARRQPDGPPQ